MLIEILCVLCLMLFTIFPCVSVGILESPTFNWWIIFETLFQVVNIWKTDKCWSSHYYLTIYVQMYLCPVTSSLDSVERQMNNTEIHLASWR